MTSLGEESWEHPTIGQLDIDRGPDSSTLVDSSALKWTPMFDQGFSNPSRLELSGSKNNSPCPGNGGTCQGLGSCMRDSTVVRTLGGGGTNLLGFLLAEEPTQRSGAKQGQGARELRPCA